jgi:hypothetical protein
MNPLLRRMRRWLTHDLLPAIQRSHQYSSPQEGNPAEAIRRQTAAAVLREADEIIELTGVSHAQALLSALERIQANSAATEAARQGACSLPRHASPEQGEPLEQVADRLDRTLRGTNQRLAASGLQVRNDEDDWQLTEAGRDWGIALPLCSRGQRRQRILWDPAVVTLLEGEG